eukprot:g37319.t1
MQCFVPGFVPNCSLMRDSVLYGLFPETGADCAMEDCQRPSLVCPKPVGLPEQGVDPDRVLQTGTFQVQELECHVAALQDIGQATYGILRKILVAPAEFKNQRVGERPLPSVAAPGEFAAPPSRLHISTIPGRGDRICVPTGPDGWSKLRVRREHVYDPS